MADSRSAPRGQHEMPNRTTLEAFAEAEQIAEGTITIRTYSTAREMFSDFNERIREEEHDRKDRD